MTRTFLLACLVLGSAAAAESQPAPSNWRRVTGLRPGLEITLATFEAPEARRYMVHADDLGITVLNVAHLSLSADVRKDLREIAKEYPSSLLAARQGGSFSRKALRIGPGGVFAHGHKAIDLADILVTVPRQDVLQISRHEKRGSGWGALAGGIAGFVVGARLGVSLGFKQCGNSCDDEKLLMGLSLIGLPIGAGALGYQVGRHTALIIEYRASP
jgi:hypothetical protein